MFEQQIVKTRISICIFEQFFNRNKNI